MSNNFYSNLKDKNVMFNDDLDSVSAFTIDLLEGYVSIINDRGVKLQVYTNISKKKSLVLQYLGVFSEFENIKELVYFLQPLYLKCKEANENDYYKKLLKKILDEKEI